MQRSCCKTDVCQVHFNPDTNFIKLELYISSKIYMWCVSNLDSIFRILLRHHLLRNLAKLDDGLNESPTVMVGEDNKQNNNSVKIVAY